MTEHPLSAADAELRERITELSVHIRRGGLRGPVRHQRPYQPLGWQSCTCEDNPQKWPGCDVSREKELCIVCLRDTAGGTSRWSWLACGTCLAVNDAIARLTGRRPFGLGRHSLMNGIEIRGGARPEVQDQQLQHLAEFVTGNGGLREWRVREFARLARPFDPDADVPLQEWQQQWPPSRAATIDAFEQLLGEPLPLRR